MGKSIFLLVFLSVSLFVNAQIGGNSASKLANYCTNPVGVNQIEFEPAFAIVSRSFVDSSFFDNSLGFRLTYGAFKNFETGISFPVGMSALQWGGKYRFIDKKFISLAVMGGINFDFSTPDFLSEIGVGGVATLQYSENFSSDVNISYMRNFNFGLIKNQIFMGIDNGIYVGNIQYILGINYQNLGLEDFYSENIFLSPGITIEPANSFLLVLSLPVSVYQNNDLKSVGFNFALTITLD